MSTTRTIVGIPYNIADQGDSFKWGTDISAWIGAVTNNALFKNGGLFQITSAVDFGNLAGLKSLYFSGRGAVANSGLFRLSNTDLIVFAGDSSLGVNTSSLNLTTNTGFEAPTVIIAGQNVTTAIANAVSQAGQGITITGAFANVVSVNVANSFSWTSPHIWLGGVNTGTANTPSFSFGNSSNTEYVVINAGNPTSANLSQWRIATTNTGTMAFQTASDAGTSQNTFLSFQRSGIAISNVDIGDIGAVNKTTVTIHGNTVFNANATLAGNDLDNWITNAYNQANTAYANGNATAVAISTAMGVQNTTFGTVNTAIGVAYGAANAAANTVEVYANGSLILAQANLNFNNGAGVNVSAVANGTTQTNVTFTVNTALTNVLAGLAYANGNATAVAISTGMGTQNTTFGTVNTTFGSVNTAIGVAYGAANAAANTVATFANGTLVLAAGNLNFNNTSTVNVSITANGTLQTNVAFSVNTSAIASGPAYSNGTFTGTFQGVSGTVTTTCLWTKIGNMAFVTIEAVTGTSTATTFTMTGLPANVVPTRAQTVALGAEAVMDNTTWVTSADVSLGASSSTLTFEKNGQQSNWTSTGTKGFRDTTTFSYALN